MSLTFSHTHQQGNGTTEVVAVLFAIIDERPTVLTVDAGKLLPNGPLMPLHRSLQAGVRQWVEEQTGQMLGYIEQLYTFVDTNRRGADGHAIIYVSYLGLLQEAAIAQPVTATSDGSSSTANRDKGAALPEHLPTTEQLTEDNRVQWRCWYDFFPWEDQLNPKSDTIIQVIIQQLQNWANRANSVEETTTRERRIQLCWGQHHEAEHTAQRDEQAAQQPQKTPTNWVAEHALLRYEMLYEAGLIPESPDFLPSTLPAELQPDWQNITGIPMYYDHRRVIVTAIARLRAKIEYRPLIFGLMPEEFTLSQLQHSVEALTGEALHKQNFRRLLIHQDLLEPTGRLYSPKRGRPAKLYRYKFDVGMHSILMASKLPKK